MHIQIINFHLKDLSEADYRGVCDELAPAFAEVPGLRRKLGERASMIETVRGRGYRLRIR